MGVEPEPVMQKPVDLAISQKSHERECCPDDGIASQERCWYRMGASLLPTSMHDQRDHRHARWQHHPRRHDLPARQEHHQGHQHREMALLKQIVMIDQVALVGESREKADRPATHYENIGPENRCPTACSCTVLHLDDFRDAHRTPPVLTSEEHKTGATRSTVPRLASYRLQLHPDVRSAISSWIAPP